MPHILIVEDEPAIADTLIYALTSDGHSTHWTTLAGEAIDYLQDQGADLVIMDVGLPDQNGFEACKRLRLFSEVPVLFLTARGSEVDRVVGLEIGADDYVVKPFSPREVAARIRGILKRTGNSKAGSAELNREMNSQSKRESKTESNSEPNSAIPADTEFVIDTNRQQITLAGQALALTRFEFEILACLVRQPERVFSREQLLQAAGISSYAGYERNIDSHIKSLRAKIRQVDADREPIHTNRGFGYSYQRPTNSSSR